MRLEQVLANLLDLYRLDFQKHADRPLRAKIGAVWDSLPSQLARENKKFLYSVVRDGARAREYEDAVQWLVDAGMVHKVHRMEKPGLPLSAYDNLASFKLYGLDVGLLRRQARLAPSAILEGDRLFTEFKGALTENYVLQELLHQSEGTPRYWAQDNPRYEVDFAVQHGNEIVPVEAKAGRAVKARGLAKYRERYGDRLCVRCSLRDLKLDGSVLNVPLPAAGSMLRLYDEAKGS